MYLESAAYALDDQFEEARNDAAKCIALKPDFVKAYHRHGVALKGLKKYHEAMAVLRAGQKIDFNNYDINKLIREIEPLYEESEKIRRSGLSPAEQIKEQGNDAFKKAAFDLAIDLYTKAIKACDNETSALALSCFNNRAACHQQMSNFSAIVGDCTHVLEYEPDNQKALLRRALAYEGLERYRLALQDIRALLSINPNIEVRIHIVSNLHGKTHQMIISIGCKQGSTSPRRMRSSSETRQVEDIANVMKLLSEKFKSS